MEETHQKRLHWGCRRGMLELDLMLIPFLEQQYNSLNDALKNDFEDLLTADDPELFRWLMGHGQPPEGYQVIARTIREYARK
ncbi:MAG: succinate dehydrogenase assembly factor 2 [Pseudomonadota bacterium]